MKTQNRKFIAIIILLLSIKATFVLGQNTTEKILYVKYGSSFGMCIGYCFNETTMSKDSTVSFSKKYGKGSGDSIPDKQYSTTTDKIKWNLLIQSINLNRFYSLPSTIGCPDCADGGAEWIEIKTDEKLYKVTFEYGAQIMEIKEPLKILRQK